MAVSNKNIDPNFNLETVDVSILDAEYEKEIKIIVMGEMDAGKSSLIKIFFGDKTPQSILSNKLEPTIGVEINIFEKNHAKIGVFDLAGQEMARWLSPKNEEMFYETDGILLFFTLSNNLKKKEIERTSKKLKYFLNEKAPKCQVTVILNKYDDYINSKSGNLKKANRIKMMVEEASQFPTYISALTPNYYPLLRLKLDRMLGTMPVEPPSIAESPVTDLAQPSENFFKQDGHIVKGLYLSDATQAFEEDYDVKISRQEIMSSEFSLGR
ncbi:ADP-ribosylation factor-like protein [Candidatus Lokiarchaeum ossiferum]|uniref:ADP-ribosylation factor-like protein n=1 Tax=Candidatus Lokiarchaeum ossiferum TaxID=2951803 RepID=UPI00352E563A